VTHLSNRNCLIELARREKPEMRSKVNVRIDAKSWLRDPRIRSVSLAARGLVAELLCRAKLTGRPLNEEVAMLSDPPHGQHVAAACAISYAELGELIRELQAARVLGCRSV